MKYGGYLEQLNDCQLLNSLLGKLVNIRNIRPCYPTCINFPLVAKCFSVKFLVYGVPTRVQYLILQ